MTLTRPKLMKTAPSTSAVFLHVFLREVACKGPKHEGGDQRQGRSGGQARVRM